MNHAQQVRQWIQNARRTAAQWLSAPEPAQGARSSLRDSSQIGISATATFSPEDFRGDGYEAVLSKRGVEQRRQVHVASGPHLTYQLRELFAEGWTLESISSTEEQTLTVQGGARLYAGFRPDKAILTERITATCCGPGLPDRHVAIRVEDAGDVMLTQAWAGSENCMGPGREVSGRAFAGTPVGDGVWWPMVQGGTDLLLVFAIGRSVLGHFQAPPEGYESVPRVLKVDLRMTLLGPRLR